MSDWALRMMVNGVELHGALKAVGVGEYRYQLVDYKARSYIRRLRRWLARRHGRPGIRIGKLVISSWLPNPLPPGGFDLYRRMHR